MRIERISTKAVDLPVDKPFRIYYGDEVRSIKHVLVQAWSDEGHMGVGYSFVYWHLPMLKTAVDELKEIAVGRDPFEVRSIWRDLMLAMKQFGPGGLAHFAINAIDVALWDLVGKITGEPLYMLFGGGRQQVPCYYPGFWRSTPTVELGREAGEARVQGFRAVKMKLGANADIEDEIGRVKAVREAIGPDIRLMVDANQGWTPEFAISIGERLKEFDVYWIEDPVPNEDMEGRARVAEEVDIPVATGEEVYTKAGFKELVDRGAGDIFDVDSQRLGGITGALDVVSFLEARNLVFTSHLMPEIQAHVIAASEKGLTVEFMPWSFGLFKDKPLIKDGLIQLPKAPGIGLELDEKAIRRYEVK